MRSTGVAALGTILSVWAHPDDETYLAGGIMAAAVAGGQRVVCLSATAGEHGTDDPGTWPPERLARVRRLETAAAMAILGVTEHRWLGYEDGGLAAMDPAAPVDKLAGLINEVRPDTILTFGPDGATFHSDHQTVSKWARAAWDKTGRAARLLYSTVTDEHLTIWADRYEEWSVFMTDERPAGTPVEALALRVVLEGPALDQKIVALCAMYTQTSPAVALMGMADYAALNAAEYFVEETG